MQKDTFVMTPVESSQISAIGYENQKLKVRFKNEREYLYQNVPVELYEKMMAAESVGKFFVAEIKKKPDLYPFEELGVASE